VIDDGIGGAAARNGSGLTGLTDRVAARGGTLTIDSDNGRGTTLIAEFPCVS
jgi:signal transduction histidine kinase